MEDNNNDYVVRRLTPVECERLQNFPDNWTLIPGASDTARYKALGNSIALPQWQIIIDNMAKYLPDGATLGSLFDGIGGFRAGIAAVAAVAAQVGIVEKVVLQFLLAPGAVVAIVVKRIGFRRGEAVFCHTEVHGVFTRKAKIADDGIVGV